MQKGELEAEFAGNEIDPGENNGGQQGAKTSRIHCAGSQFANHAAPSFTLSPCSLRANRRLAACVWSTRCAPACRTCQCFEVASTRAIQAGDEMSRRMA